MEKLEKKCFAASSWFFLQIIEQIPVRCLRALWCYQVRVELVEPLHWGIYVWGNQQKNLSVVYFGCCQLASSKLIGSLEQVSISGQIIQQLQLDSQPIFLNPDYNPWGSNAGKGEKELLRVMLYKKQGNKNLQTIKF